MEQDNQPIQQPTSTPEWFRNSTPLPEYSPNTGTSHSKRLLIIIGICLFVLLVAAGIVTLFLSSPKPHQAACLDTDDYRSLTGISLTSELSPTETFYGDYISFKEGLAEYDNSNNNGNHGEQLLGQIATFYTSHPEKPMVITLSGNFFSQEQEPLANQRIATVKTTLITSGIPNAAIVVKDASYVELEDAVSASVEGETSISITSDATCQ